MANDYFVKIDGIEGESNDKNHAKQIEVFEFSFGSYQNIEQGRGIDVAGRGVLLPFVFIHAIDKGSPKIQQFCMSGKNIAKVKLETCRSIAGIQTPTLEVTLENVKIIKAEVSMREVNGVLQAAERVEMVCGKETWKFTAIKPDNTKDGAIEAAFDQNANC